MKALISVFDFGCNLLRFCGFAVFDDFLCGFSVSNRPLRPPGRGSTVLCYTIHWCTNFLPLFHPIRGNSEQWLPYSAVGQLSAKRLPTHY